MTTLRPWATQYDAAVTLGTRHLLHYGPPDVGGGQADQGRVAPRADKRGVRPAGHLFDQGSLFGRVCGRGVASGHARATSYLLSCSPQSNELDRLRLMAEGRVAYGNMASLGRRRAP